MDANRLRLPTIGTEPFRSRAWTGITLATSLLLATAVSSCSKNDDNKQETGGDEDAAAQTGNFTPPGCSFTIAPHEGFAHWKHDSPATGTGKANIRYVRLGVGGKPSAADVSTVAAIAWQTDEGDFGTEVRWGTTPDPSSWPKEQKVTGVTWVTPRSRLGQNPERMHEAYICGLKPATRYYYQVLSGADRSEVYSFQTAPQSPDKSVKIAITGDSRGEGGNAWQLIQQRLMDRKVDLQLFSGDMVNLSLIDRDWEHWLASAWKTTSGKPSSLAQIPMAAIHGNHEITALLYYGNVVLPQDVNEFPEYPEHFFSLDIGPVHVIGVDDYFVCFPHKNKGYAPRLREWLRQDLKRANAHRDQRPWIIVMRHHPSYSSSNHGDDKEVLEARKFFVPLWEEGKVDLEFSGHDHNYERSKPLLSGGDVDHPKEADGGVRYIVCAGSGAPGYGNGTSDFTAYSAAYKGTDHLGVYGVVEASKKRLVWHSYWVDANGDTEVEPPVELTK